MSCSRVTGLLAVGAFLLWSVAQASAQSPSNQRDQNPGYQANPSQRSEMHTRGETGHGLSKCVQSRKIVGATVQDSKGDKLGSIDDLVIDTENGKVEYAALGVGGVLGVGEKLFAIPFEQLKISHDSSNNPYFVIDISKERLEKAPGFDKNNWPDFANPQWRNDVNNYYRHSSASVNSDQTRPASAESNP